MTDSSSSTGNGSGGRKEQRDEGPFTLHNSDHPGTALVNTPLTGTNYLTWSLAIKTSLEAKDKLGFIDGSLPAPTDEADFKRWKKADSMVKAWINNSLGKDIADTIVSCNSAKKLWDILASRYGKSSGPQLYQLQREMSSIQQGTDSVTIYYGKLYRAWDQIDRLVPQPTCQCDKCTCDVNGKLKAITESTRLLQFLMGLNLEFKPIRRHILNLDPLPQVDRAFAMVISAESEQEVTMTYSASGVEASAMMVKGQNTFRSDADKKRDAAKKDRLCNHCNVAGHTREACFKLHGYPECNGANQESTGGKGEEKQTEIASMVSQIIKQEMGKYFKGKEGEEHVNFANLMNFAGNTQNGNFLSLTHGSWILDTGASSHICSNINLVQQNFFLNPPIKVHLPDSSTKPVHTKGQVVLHSKLTLHNVLLIPSFDFNLLSVNKLVKETNLHLIFHKHHCILQDLKSEEIIAIAGVRRNLYILEPRSFDPFVIKHSLSQCDSLSNVLCNAIPISNEKTSVVWHQRLGHCPLLVLNHINSIKNTELKHLPVCDVCHLAKQNRIPFLTSETKAQEALELLHIDVWGPYAKPSLTNAHYVLSIVDDFSTVTWTHLFKFKSQVPNALDYPNDTPSSSTGSIPNISSSPTNSINTDQYNTNLEPFSDHETPSSSVNTSPVTSQDSPNTVTEIEQPLNPPLTINRNSVPSFIYSAFSREVSLTRKEGQLISWCRPDQGYIKLNTDGSSIGNLGPAGMGGLFSDSNGEWLCGFSGLIGKQTNMSAELMAIKHGLLLGLQRGFGKLMVEVDCLEAINLIKDEDISRHQLGSLIKDIRVISSSFTNFRLKHVYREANQCADGIAKMGSQNSLPFTIWETPPSAINLALLADSSASVFQQLSVVKTLNVTNYDDWYESLDMYLTVSRDDLAMREGKPADLTAQSNDAEKAFHKQWHDSNRICLTVLKYTVDKTIRQSVPEKDTVVEYLKAIGEKFKKFDKSQKAYYISLLDNARYDRVSGVREHMMKMVNYYNKLKGLKLDLGESFLVYKILESLPTEYVVLRTTYNSQETEWSINQLMSIVTQEEESQKKIKALTQSVNMLSLGSSNKKGKGKGKKHDSKRALGVKKDGKKSKGKAKEPLKGECFYCKKPGHRINECFKLKNKREKEVLGVQGSSAAVECIGTVVLNLPTGHNLVLKNVVYVPSSRRSLISTSILDALGKFPAKTRGGKANRSENILDIIHTDISGPITPATLAVELKSGKSIKAVRSDRGGEYYGRYTESGRNPGPFALFLKEHGTEAQYTMPGTPQQNGVAERRNRTLMDMVPSKSVENTPYELFTAKKPTMKHLRVWGCKAEVRPYNPQLKKLDPKTISGYFIGYCLGSRGNRFYCPSHSTRVIESDRAYYFENDSDSGSEAPRAIQLRNEDTYLLMPSAVSSFSDMPSTSQDNRNDNIVVDPVEEQLREPPANIVNEHLQEPVINLRRSERNRRSAIPNDYYVYLQEFESNLFLFVREKISQSQTCLVHIPGEQMLADPMTKGLPVGVFKNHVSHMGIALNL
ncbi:Retrovirus-related Pol polyprotein from transposon TNT 1-94 [Senna tora]|uniref:Retrovirus-related Pol polyprotein from transposon TNT 1-94 n=1 Tax=Senna tora TaxID=362788 RepID=A0A834W8Z0_9FABA|nr:Retrovirus-related Pol polyprotein from transposon TNT 1-94 [Senna tora]